MIYEKYNCDILPVWFLTDSIWSVIWPASQYCKLFLNTTNAIQVTAHIVRNFHFYS